MTPLLDVAEAAGRLSVSRQTIRRMIDAGELPYVSIGSRVLIRPTDLDKFIEKRLGTRHPKAKVA